MAESKRSDRSELDALKRAVSLVDIAASYGLVPKPPSNGSKNYLARCVLHQDTEESLSIHFCEDEGKWLWNCFGCKSGGDSITFHPAPREDQLQDRPGPPPRVRRHPAAGIGRGAVRTGAAPHPAAGLEPPRPPHHRHGPLPEEALGVPGSAGLPAAAGAGLPGAVADLRPGLLRRQPAPHPAAQGDVRLGLTVLGVLNEYSREHFKGCIVVPVDHPDDGLVDLYGRRADTEAKKRHLYLKGPQRGVFNWQALQTALVVPSPRASWTPCRSGPPASPTSPPPSCPATCRWIWMTAGPLHRPPGAALPGPGRGRLGRRRRLPHPPGGQRHCRVAGRAVRARRQLAPGASRAGGVAAGRAGAASRNGAVSVRS